MNHCPPNEKKGANAANTTPVTTAISTARQKTACSSSASPRPKAWDTSPVVPERRKLNVLNTTSKTSAPAARPPSKAASPSCPTTAVSVRPSKGVVR